MVDFVLDDLGRPAGEGLDTGLELLILPPDFDGLVPLTGAGVTYEGKATFPGFVGVKCF